MKTKEEQNLYMREYRKRNSSKILKKEQEKRDNLSIEEKRIKQNKHNEYLKSWNKLKGYKYQKKWKLENKEQARVSELKRHREKMYHLKRYKIDKAQYDQMLQNQNEVCAICNQPETMKDKKSNNVRRLAVDYDHNTGEVRQLLCTRCNQIIGNVGEDILILQAMVNYILRHKQELIAA